MPKVTLNCDMGEGFGVYSFGADEELMALVDVANVACGFHGSDSNHMRRTVQLAKAHDVEVGAHPALPDLQGFGRRLMSVSREEIANCVLYQIGALSAFLKAEGMELSHVKPHGALYGMAARDPEVAHGIADAIEVYGVPAFGLPGTFHESIYKERGLTFVPEFFADLEYDDQGALLITRHHSPVDPDKALQRTVDAVANNILIDKGGVARSVYIETICVHSDTPNAVMIAKTIAGALAEMKQ